MRSARMVSSVMTMTLGGSVAAAASAGGKTRRQRMMARRINKKGACIVADSFFGTKTGSRRSEDDLCSDLRGTCAALRKIRVSGGDVRRLPIRSEATISESVAGGRRLEVRMVQ